MQLTPEQIHEFISKAIIESHIGQAVKDSIDRVIKGLNETYKNPIDKVVWQYITSMVHDMLQKERFPEIQDHVKKSLEKYVTKNMVDKLMNGVISRLNNYE